MKPTPWQRLDILARKLTPFGMTLILVLLGVMPLHLPDFVRVTPALGVMAVYHWTIHRPELLPAYAVFAIGFLQDVLTGAPIGVNALVFLTVYGVVLTQRRFFVGRSFLIAWLGFSLVAAGAALESWILVAAYHVTLVEPRQLFFQYLVTLGCFPFLACVFLRWQQAVLRQG